MVCKAYVVHLYFGHQLQALFKLATVLQVESSDILEIKSSDTFFLGGCNVITNRYSIELLGTGL